MSNVPGAPDSDPADRVELAYYADGSKYTRKDQRGCVHTYEYDDIGRLTKDRVTTLGGADDAVRAILHAYDAAGRRETVTSYLQADPTPGTDTPVNEVKFTYDGLGRVTKSQQEHDGAVDGGTPDVDYAYAAASGGIFTDGSRLAKITYPAGREVFYNYDTNHDAAADAMSRVTDIADDASGTTKYAQYTYLGSGTIVKVAHPDVSGGLELAYDPDGDNSYDGWDRFGRVVDQLWQNDSSTVKDRFQYTYDRGSNRTTRDLTLTTGLDEKYTYDGLDRLTAADRGTLVSGSITSKQFAQDWTLSQTGNWSGFSEDADGDGFDDDDGDLTQSRTHNDVNELTALAETHGPAWIDPAHDAAGNMTLAPRPGDEADANDALVCVYDGWNRLVETYDDDDADGVADAGELIATYTYDGLNRRIRKVVEGDPDEAYDYYFLAEGTTGANSQWRIIEVRKDSDTDPLKQYVWGRRYVHSPVVRWRDANTDGDYDDAGDDTLYYCNDANFNVTALVAQATGSAVERYAYDPYGKVAVLDADWFANADNASDVGNVVLYTGHKLDTETMLYWCCRRYYHPTLGRWTRRDPLNQDASAGGYHDGMGLYEYVGGGPTMAIDPLGQRKLWRWIPVLVNPETSEDTYRAEQGEVDVGPETMYSADVSIKADKAGTQGAWFPGPDGARAYAYAQAYAQIRRIDDLTREDVTYVRNAHQTQEVRISCDKSTPQVFDGAILGVRRDGSTFATLQVTIAGEGSNQVTLHYTLSAGRARDVAFSDTTGSSESITNSVGVDAGGVGADRSHTSETSRGSTATTSHSIGKEWALDVRLKYECQCRTIEERQ